MEVAYLYFLARYWQVNEGGSDIEVVEGLWQRTLTNFVEVVKV